MPKNKPMKAKSKTQRRLFGWAKACVDNKTDNCPTNIKKLGKTFKEKYPEDLKSLAKTKHLGLPDKKKKISKKNEVLSFSRFINEEIDSDIDIDDVDIDYDAVITLLKSRGFGDISYGWFDEFEKSESYSGTTDTEKYYIEFFDFINSGV